MPAVPSGWYGGTVMQLRYIGQFRVRNKNGTIIICDPFCTPFHVGIVGGDISERNRLVMPVEKGTYEAYLSLYQADDGAAYHSHLVLVRDGCTLIDETFSGSIFLDQSGFVSITDTDEFASSAGCFFPVEKDAYYDSRGVSAVFENTVDFYSQFGKYVSGSDILSMVGNYSVNWSLSGVESEAWSFDVLGRASCPMHSAVYRGGAAAFSSSRQCFVSGYGIPGGRTEILLCSLGSFSGSEESILEEKIINAIYRHTT